MKTTTLTIGGREYHLCCNGAAYYDLRERFAVETGESVLDPIRQEGKPGFTALCAYLWKLGEQGELVRRYQGYDRAAMVSEAEWRTTLLPGDIPAAKAAVAAAVMEGLHASTAPGEDERVDLGLAELEKKNETGSPRGRYVQIITQFLGLSYREGMMLLPGQVLDLLRLERQRRGLQKEA